MEAYAVSVRVSLVNQVSAGLLRMVGQFKAAEIGAAGLKRELKGIQSTMIAGAAITAVGVGILAMFKPALDQAKLFQQEVTKFSLYGMGDQANAEAVRFAKGMNVMGSSYVDNMRLMTEAQGIFRESGKLTLAEQLQGAKIAAPILAKLAFIESGLSEDQRASRHAQDLAMLRFIEARGGANDPRTFAAIADWGYRLQQSSGGVVNWSGLQQLVATAGASGFNLTQDAISALEPVIADLKGGKVGSGMRVAFSRLMGIQRMLPKQAIAEYLSLGLWDQSKIEMTSGGTIKRFLGAPGSVLKDSSLFATDPVGFYTKDFLPAILKKYGPSIMGDSVQARVERAAEITNVFGPGNAGAVFSQIDKLLPAIQRSLAAQNKQIGIEGAYGKVGTTLAGKQIEMAAKFRDLLEQTGEVALPLVTQALEAILPVLTSVSNWAQAHPTAFKWAIDGIIGLGVALTVSGIATSLTGLVRVVMLFTKLVGPASGMARILAATDFGGLAANAGILGSKIPLVAAGMTALEAPMAALAALPLAAIGVGLGAIAAAALAMILVHKYQAHEDETKNTRGGHGVAGAPRPIIPAHINPYSPTNMPARGHARGPTPTVNPYSPQGVRTARGFIAAVPEAQQRVQHFAGSVGQSSTALAGHDRAIAAVTKSTNTLAGAESAFASWLGSAIGQLKTAFANMAQSAAAPNVPPRPGAHQPAIHGEVHIDGRKVGHIVAGHIGSSIGGQRVGSARFDPNTALAASGAGYGH